MRMSCGGVGRVTWGGMGWREGRVGEGKTYRSTCPGARHLIWGENSSGRRGLRGAVGRTAWTRGAWRTISHGWICAEPAKRSDRLNSQQKGQTISGPGCRANRPAGRPRRAGGMSFPECCAGHTAAAAQPPNTMMRGKGRGLPNKMRSWSCNRHRRPTQHRAHT